MACTGVLLGALLLVATGTAELLEGAELLAGAEEITAAGVELGKTVAVLPSEPPPPQPVRAIVSKPAIANLEVQFFLKLKIILTT